MSLMTSSRTIVIADIHGCNLTFRKLIFGQIRLVKSDILYLLGDYIDRGPDSSGVVETILDLKEEGYNVMPIKGNHEQLFIGTLQSPIIERVAEWLDNGGYTTLKSYGVIDTRDLPYDHLLFLKCLPLYLSTETHIFVHAGLDFCLVDPLSDKGEKSMLWKRLGDVDESKSPKWQN